MPLEKYEELRNFFSVVQKGVETRPSCVLRANSKRRARTDRWLCFSVPEIRAKVKANITVT